MSTKQMGAVPAVDVATVIFVLGSRPKEQQQRFFFPAPLPTKNLQMGGFEEGKWSLSQQQG